MANTNENLVYGWSNQQLGNTAGQSGYSQPGNAPAATTVSAAEQPSSGASFAPAPTTNVTEVLTNPGYALTPANITPGPVTAPSLPTSSTGVAVNPSGLSCVVTVVTGAGATVTDVQVAPANSSTYTDLTTTVAASSSGTFSVPPGGKCKITYTGTPTWTWVAVS